METDSAEQEPHLIKRVRLQGPAECAADLRHILNNSTFSDIVFVCNDGKRIQALRKLVAGRSEMLKSLLLNGMAETRQSEVELPEISSRALLSVLEFLYTGILLDYRPKSWTAGCELILASRFFILPTLENLIRIFMHEEISSVLEDKTKAASMLTKALRYGLCGERDDFLKELVRILDQSRFQYFDYVQDLSEDAFHYLLANSKGKDKVHGCLSFREYKRFMLVILWWFYKSDLGSEEKEHLERFIPAAEARALSLCGRQNDVDIDEDAPSFFSDSGANPRADAPRFFSDSALCQLHDESKSSVIRLLSNIDCKKIHPILLSNVVEPLELISATEILNSFRFHALHRDIDFCIEPEYIWDHSENCIPLDLNPRSISKVASKIGLAVMREAVYTRRIIIFKLDEVCDDFVELGFFNYYREVGAERPEFGGERLSDQDHGLVLKFQGSQVSVKLEGPLGRVDWKLLKTYSSNEEVVEEVVTFTFVGSQQNCYLSLDKGACNFGVIWKNLSRRLYYPAVSFGDSSKGLVRLLYI